MWTFSRKVSFSFSVQTRVDSIKFTQSSISVESLFSSYASSLKGSPIYSRGLSELVTEFGMKKVLMLFQTTSLKSSVLKTNEENMLLLTRALSMWSIVFLRRMLLIQLCTNTTSRDSN